MKKKHISFHKTPQFHQVVGDTRYYSENNNIPYPKIGFHGTVKIDGTNCSVCTNNDEIWFQSRKRIITVDSDNYGFASFANKRIESFEKMLNKLKQQIAEDDYTVAIYGEFCGQGIQNGAGVCKLPKMFVIFAAKVAFDDKDSYYLDHSNLRDIEEGLYNIEDFPTFEVEVDFNNPKPAADKFKILVDEIGKECPVAKKFGVIGDGEGIVWSADYRNSKIVFKTKTEKAKSTKTKKPKIQISPEKLNSIKEFVEYAVTENRMKQAVEELFTSQNISPDIKKMGDFIRWVVSDVHAEESDTLAANDLAAKDVNSSISNICRNWFQNLLKENAGL